MCRFLAFWTYIIGSELITYVGSFWFAKNTQICDSQLSVKKQIKNPLIRLF